MVPEGFASGTRRGPFWPCAAAVALLLGLALTGCASAPTSGSSNSSSSSSLMGAGYTDNSLGDQVRGYRKPDSDAGFDGVSSKSQQIEKDLGVQ